MVAYPKEWNKQRLGNLSRIKTGTRNNEEKVSNGKYPFFVRSENVERINSYSYDTEAILVPGEGNIESVFHYIKGKFDVHQRVYAITNFSATVSARYIFWFMSKYFGTYALQNTSKATVDSLRLPAFENFVVYYPDLSEQKAIADTLSTFDEHIENLTKLIEKKKAIRDGALEDLVSRKVRLSGFDGEWKVCKIGDILTILHGKSQHLVENSRGRYPILGTGGLMGKANAFLCDWPCVLIGRKGTIDKPLYMDVPFWSIDTLYYSKPKPQQDPKFQYYLFNTISWYEYTESSGRPSLSKDVIENIDIRVPNYQEQQAIASVLTAMDDEINSLEQERNKIIQIKDGAMDDLLTGKVRLV